MKKSFIYRDGANYKTYFNCKVTKSGKDLKKGDRITMGEHGTPTKLEFFGSDTHPYQYNDEFDHNIFEVAK